ERVGDAERAERRRPPAARLAAVDDVVVQQRGRVDQLERDGRLDRVVAPHLWAVAGGGVEDEQHDRRADALAAGLHEVARDRLHAALARRELRVETHLDAREVVLDRGREAWAGRGDGGIHGASGLNSNAPAKSRTCALRFRDPVASVAAWRSRRRSRYAT